MTTLEFLSWYGPYQKGHIASFPDDVGQRLIDSGKAVRWTPPKSDAPPKRGTTTEKMVTK